MAKSLDELIDFLLEQIALTGEKGLKLAELVASISAFYHPTGGQIHGATASQQTTVQQVPRLPDRNFISHVWKWLGHHPDVFIGSDGQFNDTKLDQLEEQVPRYLSNAISQASEILSRAEDAHGRADRSSDASEPRFYVTEDRMSLAICGHLPDPSKVFPTEWQLLSHIASTRRAGILQGELGRATGQDKRSVPRRTDMLQDKGYIVKKTVYVKGIKTSRLYLRRFIAREVDDSEPNHQQHPLHTERLTVKYHARQLFDVLKTNPLISLEDLTDALAMSDPGRAKVLALIIRHFGRMGCLKRVKTAFGPSAVPDDLKISIQFLREPIDADWTASGTDSIDFEMTVEELAKPYEHLRLRDLDPEEPSRDVFRHDSDLVPLTYRIVPRWNPDRILANTLLDLVREAGMAGVKLWGLRSSVTGPLVRRMLESFIIKLSHQSPTSQPAGLKHLAIIRSRQATDTVTQFVYYTLDAYMEKVRQGKAAWSDVSGLVRTTLQSDDDISAGVSESFFEKDVFGFPLRTPDVGQLRNAKAMQAELIRQAKVKDIYIGQWELVLRNSASRLGTAEEIRELEAALAFKGKRGPPGRLTPGQRTRDGSKAVKKIQSDSAGQIIRGRPRKFLAGTEKFWRDIFAAASRAITSTTASIRRAGATGKDSAGNEVFLARPQNFDATLVRAIEAGLPVPSQPSEVTQSWVDDTISILELPRDGLYFTHTGIQYRSKRLLSKFMVLKTTRLRELDLTEKWRTWDWQYLTSSAAHSIRYRLTDENLHQRSKTEVSATDASKIPSQGTHITIGAIRGVSHEEVASDAGVQTSESSTRQSLSQAYPSAISEGFLSAELDIQPSRPATASSDHEEMPKSPKASPVPQSFSPTLHDAGFEEDHRINTPTPLPLPGRSTRSRRPTQKAIQNMAGRGRSRVMDKLDTRKGGAKETASVSSERSREKGDVDGEGTPMRTPASPGKLDLSSSPRAIPKDTQPPTEVTAEPVSLVSRMETAPGHSSTEVLDHGESNQASSTFERTPVPVSTPGLPDSTPEPTPGPLDDEDIRTAEKFIQPELQPPSPSKSSCSPARLDSEQESEDSDMIRPAKRLKYSQPKVKISQKESSKVCRSVSIDLIKLCSGLAPSDPWTFRRAMAARWVESGIDAEPPNARMVRRNLNVLANGAKVRHITFAFRSKSGAVVTKSIIALRKFDGSSPEVLELQRKMTESYPEDYVPPELSAEFDRPPASVRTVKQRDDEEEEVEEKEEEEEYTEYRSVSKKPKASRPPRRPRRSKSRDDLILDADPALLPAASVFLTLKVSQLHTLNLTTDSRTATLRPPANLFHRSERSPSSFLITGAPQNTRRTGLRPKRRSKFNVENHNIIWIDERNSAFPQSLDDIPNVLSKRDEAMLNDLAGSDYNRFQAEISSVAAWEERAKDLFLSGTCEHNFINHYGARHETSYCSLGNQILFENFILVDHNSTAQETRAPDDGSWPPFVQALAAARAAEGRVPPPVRAKRKYTKRNRFVVDDDDDLEFEENGQNDEVDRPARKRQRTTRPKADRRQRTHRKAKTRDMNNGRPKKFRRPVQVVRYMPEEMQYRIVISIIVTRTLAGGVDKFIDWSVITRLFPDQEEEYLQVAWKSLSNRYRADVNGLTESLQEKYLDALVADEVPSILFDDSKSTDWEGIIGWAMTNLERFQISKVDELPESRKVFLDHNDYTVVEPAGICNSFNFGTHTTQPRREEAMAGLVFGTGVTPLACHDHSLQKHFQQPVEDPAIVRAKSWVLSLLLTSEATYDADHAHEFLLNLAASPDDCEQLVDDAIKSLQRSKWISRSRTVGRALANKTNIESGWVRTWQVSTKYYEQFKFRRQISGSMLKVAAQYKVEVLDTAFSRGAGITIGPDFMSDAGEMIAIVNLIAQGAIDIRPGKDLPDTRYGLDWERQGYSTRLIDKATLGFSVDLHPVPYAYEYGDPLEDGRQEAIIPRGEIPESNSFAPETGRIPPWFDINLRTQPEMWDMVSGAVVGLISIRPGVDPLELSNSLAAALSPWEVSLVVEYLLQIGAVKKTASGHGFETLPWWWMCLGP